MARMKLSQIRTYWTDQAGVHGAKPQASWSDFRVMEMECRELCKYINDGDKVLDVGCANGYTTMHVAAQKNVRIHGVDYIPRMIASAKKGLRAHKAFAARVSFSVGDIMKLKFPAGNFDTVMVVRVVINLGTWTRQLHAMRECLRVLKPGGLLLLSEATLQGWRRLNLLRVEWGLPTIPVPSFNTYLDQKKVATALRGHADLLDIANYTSTYFVGTRVLKPLLIKALSLNADPSDPGMEWNRLFSLAPSIGDYGTQKIFIFRKKR